MLRKLFLRELIKSTVAHAGIYASFRIALFFADLIAAKRNLIQSGDAAFFGNYLIAGLVASGLVSGERSFPADFKGGRYFFLVSLPIPRSRIWLALSLSRLIGVLVLLPIILITLPIPLSKYSRELGMPLSLAVSCFACAYLVAFAGGLFSALALRRELMIYLAGLTLLGTIIAVLGRIFLYVSMERFVLPSLLAFAVILASLSRRSFVDGDFGDPRRNVRRHLALGISTIIFLVAALFLARLNERWDFSFGSTGEGRALSGDGKVLAVASSLVDRQIDQRLQFLSLESGFVEKERRIRGISQVLWFDPWRAFNVVAWDWAEELNPESSHGRISEWTRFSKSGKLISRRRLVGHVTLHKLISGHLLVIIQNDSRGRGYIAGRDDKHLQFVLGGPLGDDDLPHVDQIDGGDRVIFFFGKLGEPRKRIVWDLNVQGVPVERYEVPEDVGWIDADKLVAASRRHVPILSSLRHPWEIDINPLSLAYVSKVSGASTVTVSSDFTGCIATSPVCQKGERGLVRIYPTSSWERTVVETFCIKNWRQRKRYWLHGLRSGAMTELKGLPEDSDLIPPGPDGSLVWWTPSGEIWRSVSGGQPYRVGSDAD
jgi:hypothetical protein